MKYDDFTKITSYWKSFNSSYSSSNIMETKFLANAESLEIVDNEDLEEINQYVKEIQHRGISKNDKSIWDLGWGQNYEYLLKEIDINFALVPSYFGKYPFVRLLGELYLDNDLVNLPIKEMIFNPERNKSQKSRYESIEYLSYRIMLEQLVYYPALKFFEDNKCANPIILDLGAGTCHNIWHLNTFLRKNNIHPKFIAADWSKATKDIVNYLSINTSAQIDYSFIDFNNKDTWSFLDEINFDLIYTVGSLEQLPGDPYNLIEKLSLNKPNNKKIITIEPVTEALSEFNKEDKLIINYINNRNYLNSFLASLLRFEIQNKGDLNISINRVGYGSLFLDAYTRINWSTNIIGN